MKAPIMWMIVAVTFVAAPGVAASPSERQDCPYDFQDETPAGVFCAYEAKLVGADCRRSGAVIWSAGTEPGAPERSRVVLGFTTAPELIVEAIAAGGDTGAAEVDRFAHGGGPEASLGVVELPDDGRMLEVSFAGDRRPRVLGCSIDRVVARFVGVMGAPGAEEPGLRRDVRARAEMPPPSCTPTVIFGTLSVVDPRHGAFVLQGIPHLFRAPVHVDVMALEGVSVAVTIGPDCTVWRVVPTGPIGDPLGEMPEPEVQPQ